ncbi:quinolinate synthase NadA [Pelodictyon luteolum]|uniref:Quinolinate synthase n=1 Tax=Chlorobium luteolum (strain DSM 273 / BCRC 81028 / 2530) TaxID=319225 RepID=Q3B5C3_CHLL3|nr:quinolinate synthase NadA [Pelodictyon luteolum]ABB23458.1 quinolinate synthetase A [Pelodictyon luteolum DSM 273]
MNTSHAGSEPEAFSTTGLQERVRALKKEMHAVILAHYYTLPEIQEVADIVGDSLALARAAETVDAEVIVFAGVYFMGETAKILNPSRTVLMPDRNAGCPLADSCPEEEFAEFRRRHPGAVAITYINSTAATKAQSDITCTSSNALSIVRQIPPDQPIIFGPDRNLGDYIARQLGRDIILWQGFCYVHEAYRADMMKTAQREHPGAELIAHPECRREVLELASFVGSTQALLDYTQKSPSEAFIVATEPGILYEMQRRSPGKTFIPAPRDMTNPRSVCTQMKQNTLEKLYRCMLERSPEITVPEPLLSAALKPIRRMLDMSA